MSELYRDFIDGKADAIINSLGGTITPAPANAELYRDFLDRKFDDVNNAITGFIPIKSFTYVGQGSTTNTIEFTIKPTYIFSIFALNTNLNTFSYLLPFYYGQKYAVNMEGQRNINTAAGLRNVELSFNDKFITLVGESIQRAMNRANTTYTVYYI